MTRASLRTTQLPSTITSNAHLLKFQQTLLPLVYKTIFYPLGEQFSHSPIPSPRNWISMVFENRYPSHLRKGITLNHRDPKNSIFWKRKKQFFHLLQNDMKSLISSHNSICKKKRSKCANNLLSQVLKESTGYQIEGCGIALFIGSSYINPKW